MMKIALLVLLAAVAAPIVTAQAQTEHTVADYPACVEKANLDRLISFSAAGDREAFKAFLEDPSNYCIVLKGGIEVYVESYRITVVKIRPKGQTLTLWAPVEAIR
jgi:hypothetical protein